MAGTLMSVFAASGRDVGRSPAEIYVARYAAVLALERTRFDSVEREVRSVLDNIGATCRNVALGHEVQPAANESHLLRERLSREVLDYVAVEVTRSVLHAGGIRLRRALTDVRRLRWRDVRLAKLLAIDAMEERQLDAVMMPRLCVDLESWRDSGYRYIPVTSRRFLAAVSAVERDKADARVVFGNGDNARIWRLVKRHLGPDGVGKVTHLRRSTNAFGQRCARFVLAQAAHLYTLLGFKS